MTKSSEVETGEYIITYYTRKGAKLRSITETADTYISAREIGEESIASQEEDWLHATSYTIGRRMYNSLDILTL